MMNPKIAAAAQQPAPGTRIELFELDLNPVGVAAVFYFVPQTNTGGSGPLSFGGQLYTPMPIEADGFKITGQGQLPRPTLSVANVVPALQTYVRNYQDLLGAVLTRRRTYRQYLDDGSDPDPDAQMPPDVFEVRRKTHQDKQAITFELAAHMDVTGKRLPGRQIIRDVCTHTYRLWDAGAFDYSRATCPYTGTDYFTADGNIAAAAADDACGRKLSDCKLRYPGNQPLPTRAFPGVARVRAS